MHTIEINPEYAHFEKNIRQATDRIVAHTGDALDIIPTLNETFDLVFLDSNKIDYAPLYELLIDRIRPGGFLLADNMLWDGKVMAGAQDANTLAIVALIQKIEQPQGQIPCWR